MDRTTQPAEQANVTLHAAQWLLELEGHDVDEDRVAAWQRWLSESPQHRQAFDRLQSLQEHFDAVRAIPWPTDEAVAADTYDGSVTVAAFARTIQTTQPAYNDRRRRQRTLWAVGLAAATAIIAIAVFRSVDIGVPDVLRRTVLQTAIGELRRVQLADGSAVTIDGASRVTVELKSQVRDIVLDRGEAFFEVSKDARRPFIVHAGGTSILAVGTAFNVRRAGDDVTVAVAEGVVEIQRPPTQAPRAPNSALAPAASTARISAGHQVRLEPERSDTPVSLAADAVAAWREGRRHYIGEPLVNVVADLNRYSKRRIVILDKASGELTISGAVFEHDIDKWLKSLEAALPVSIRESPDGTLKIEKRD